MTVCRKEKEMRWKTVECRGCCTATRKEEKESAGENDKIFFTGELHSLAVDDEVGQLLGDLSTLLLVLRKVKLFAQLHVEHLEVQVETGQKAPLSPYSKRQWTKQQEHKGVMHGGHPSKRPTFTLPMQITLMASPTFPLLCVALSVFFILFGISSTGCSSLSAELFPSGLSSRMLSKQKMYFNISQIDVCGDAQSPTHPILNQMLRVNQARDACNDIKMYVLSI